MAILNRASFSAVLGPGLKKHFGTQYSGVATNNTYVGMYLEGEVESTNETLEVPLQELKNLWDMRFKGELVTDEMLYEAGKFYMDAAHRFRQKGFLYKKLYKSMYDDTQYTVYVVADPKDKNPEIT